MKRIALVFLLGILVPAVALALLAFRSIRDQSVILRNQRALVLQGNCEGFAADINLFFDDLRTYHGRTVDLLAQSKGEKLTRSFHEEISGNWSQAAVGIVVGPDGKIVEPGNRPRSKQELSFLEKNGAWLSNQQEAEVYQAPQLINRQVKVVKEVAPAPVIAEKDDFLAEADSAEPIVEQRVEKKKVEVSSNRLQEFRFDRSASSKSVNSSRAMADSSFTAGAADFSETDAEGIRSVVPTQQQAAPSPMAPQFPSPVPVGNLSQTEATSVRTGELVAQEDEGAVSRINGDQLQILLWRKAPSLPGFTFWTELDIKAIQRDLTPLFIESDPARKGEAVFALLDEKARPIATTKRGFAGEWRHPFVASEVGQILPRWEVGAYLIDPGALDASARSAALILSLVVVTLLGAVSIGTFLALRSIGYEMKLAARKTDFVGNVSHELKTPLTSIRMFSELLADSSEPDKTKRYAEVIGKESARLSRLINRLLDFSRLDRGEARLRTDDIDLVELVQETVNGFRPAAENVSITLESGSIDCLPVKGDSDALSQLLLNLLNNAEKYGPDSGEITVTMENGEGSGGFAVHDRGPGIPKRHRRRIFEKFYRADESIDSGVEGSGIGLALCEQIALHHQGTIEYRGRHGGGSSFVFRMPLTTTDES